MQLTLPRFWVDHSRGFNYYLVRGAEAIELSLTLKLPLGMAGETATRSCFRGEIRLRLVDRACRRSGISH